MDTLRHANQVERDDIVRALVAALETESRVLFAYLHGSFLDQPAFHDVDVAIQVTADTASACELAVALSSRLSDTAGIPVDVRALNDAPLSFRFHVLRGRLLVCRDAERLAETIEETARVYLDIEPLVRIATREAFAG